MNNGGPSNTSAATLLLTNLLQNINEKENTLNKNSN